MNHPLFDVESAIIKAGNQPSPVDLKPWQDRIDGIVGKTATGQSRLRIEWGQSAEMISCGRVAMKHLFYRHQKGGVLYDIGTPRFYVGELHSNAELQRKEAWDRARYYFDEETRELIDVLGPIPEEGFYTTLFQIAHHDERCCSGKEVVKNEPCLGGYREPGEIDLTRIRRMKYRRDNASNDDNMPSESLIRKRAQDLTAKRDEKWRSNIRERIEDFMNTHAWKFSTFDPTEIGWGRYHFVGENAGHSKSGLKKEAVNAVSSSAALSA